MGTKEIQVIRIKFYTLKLLNTDAFRAERRGTFSSVRPILENNENEPYIFSFNLNNSSSGTNVSSMQFDQNAIQNSSSSETVSNDTLVNENSRNTEDSEGKSASQTVIKLLKPITIIF